MKAAAEAAANRRFEKIERSSIGARVWRSIKTHSGNSTAAAARPAITTGIAPAGEAALGDAEYEPGQPDHESERAERVEAAHLVGLG